MMSLKDTLSNTFYKIDSHEKTNTVLTIFQLLATVSAFSYSIYEDSQIIARWSIYSFAFFQLTVLSFLIITLIISLKYRVIKLRLRKNTGVLYDETTNFRNVSLRANTLNIILDNIKDTKKAYETGKEAGESFYDSFENELHLKGKNYTTKNKLIKWLEYDSSSGMGKLEALSLTGFPIKLKITSPFMGVCPNQNPNWRCRFLLGYIDGFCSKLYDKKLESKCEHNIDPSCCILTLEPAN